MTGNAVKTTTANSNKCVVLLENGAFSLRFKGAALQRFSYCLILLFRPSDFYAPL
jgi:hypothetical protein